MSGLDLWLVRHGETEVNSGTWNSDPRLATLTSLGVQQAKGSAAQITDAPDLFVISPLIRARETACFFQERWPDTPAITSGIQEIIYLSPARMNKLSKEERKAYIDAYWLRADPEYCDGEDAESFAAFLKRVNLFYEQLRNQHGFIVAIGHGQFFKAFMLGLRYGFTVSSDWMKRFRHQEQHNPLKNGEIIKVLL